MNFFRSRLFRQKWCLTPRRSLPVRTLTAASLTPIFLLGITGCLGQTEVVNARMTKLPTEVVGMARIEQASVKVGVVGTDKVGIETIPSEQRQPGFFKRVKESFHHVFHSGKVVSIPAGGMLVVHEQDMAALIQNTQQLQNQNQNQIPLLNRLLADPDVVKKAVEKKIVQTVAEQKTESTYGK